jgi:hypothetical protein
MGAPQPSLGAVAMGYDLCYDGWDEAFRLKVAKAIQLGPLILTTQYPVADWHRLMPDPPSPTPSATG